MEAPSDCYRDIVYLKKLVELLKFRLKNKKERKVLTVEEDEHGEAVLAGVQISTAGNQIEVAAEAQEQEMADEELQHGDDLVATFQISICHVEADEGN
jgi:hypothetical protein